MLKVVFLAGVVLIPGYAAAADLHRYREHRTLVRRVLRTAEPTRFISCTTHNFVLFRVSNCGAFDPLSISGL